MHKFKFLAHLSVVSSPDPTLEEGKGSGDINFINEHFLGSCKLSILTFAKANQQIAAPRLSCDLASDRIAKIPADDLALANEIAVQ